MHNFNDYSNDIIDNIIKRSIIYIIIRTWLYSIYGEGNGTPLQYSCLENPMERGAWQAAVHEVAKSWTRLSDFTFTFIFHFHALEQEMATHSSVLAWSHWSIFLFLCQYHTFLMTVTLEYGLKSGGLIPPASFLFLKTALAIWGLFCFHTNCENFEQRHY